MKTLLLTVCIFSSFYADWLSTGENDVNFDGIVNLKDWNIIQSKLAVLRSRPTPDEVEALALSIAGNYRLMNALKEHVRYKQVGNRIEVYYEWECGWFELHWEYTATSYKFRYWYGDK
jgi:hypothetical protein